MIYFSIKRNRYFENEKSGRNNAGKITVRGRQKPNKRGKARVFMGFNYLYKDIMIRFFYFFNVLKARVVSRIVCINGMSKCIVVFLNSLLKDCYVCLPWSKSLKLSDVLLIGNHNFLSVGNIIRLQNVPTGGVVHSVAVGCNFYIRKSNKNSYILYCGDKYVTVKLPSGKLKLINKEMYCIFGELEFGERNIIKTAGENRLRGYRPMVRGVAMNACDHPHGGGEGKGIIGRKSIFSIWGKKCKGVRTKTR